MLLARKSALKRLVAPAMAFANLVCVERSTSRARPGAYQRAFLSADDGAYARAGRRCSSYRELISVLLPKTAGMAMASVACLCGHARHRERQTHEHQH